MNIIIVGLLLIAGLETFAPDKHLKATVWIDDGEPKTKYIEVKRDKYGNLTQETIDQLLDTNNVF